MSELQVGMGQAKRGCPDGSRWRKPHVGGRRWPWLKEGRAVVAGHWLMVGEVAVQVARTEEVGHGRIRVHLDRKLWSECPVQDVVVLALSKVRMAGPDGKPR